MGGLTADTGVLYCSTDQIANVCSSSDCEKCSSSMEWASDSSPACIFELYGVISCHVCILFVSV